MSGFDPDETTGGWRTEEIPPTEAKRLVDAAVQPQGLTPITLPDMDDVDAPTEAVGASAFGTELPERYDVRESLGPEEDGDLFRVFDTLLQRDVVMKVVREGASSRVSEALHEEARTVARVRHPGAVTVFDVGVLEDGRAFATREILEGRPLGPWVESVDPMRLVRWMMWAVDTVASAQRAGLQHLRLEPSCIRVGRVVKVTGFGSGVADVSPFMAPELVSGAGGDARSDVFSLGVITKTLLGERMPAGLGSILDRATAVEVWERQHAAEALLADLEDWLVQPKTT